MMGGGRFEGAKLSEPAETERSRALTLIPLTASTLDTLNFRVKINL